MTTQTPLSGVREVVQRVLASLQVSMTEVLGVAMGHVAGHALGTLLYKLLIESRLIDVIAIVETNVVA